MTVPQGIEMGVFSESLGLFLRVHRRCPAPRVAEKK